MRSSEDMIKEFKEFIPQELRPCYENILKCKFEDLPDYAEVISDFQKGCSEDYAVQVIKKPALN